MSKVCFLVKDFFCRFWGKKGVGEGGGGGGGVESLSGVCKFFIISCLPLNWSARKPGYPVQQTTRTAILFFCKIRFLSLFFEKLKVGALILSLERTVLGQKKFK